MAHVLITAPPLFEALPFLKGGLTLLVVTTAFASFLIPAAILLFFFAPIRIWRSPLFIFNVLSIALGLTLQTLYIYVIVSYPSITLCLINIYLTYTTDQYHPRR